MQPTKQKRKRKQGNGNGINSESILYTDESKESGQQINIQAESPQNSATARNFTSKRAEIKIVPAPSIRSQSPEDQRWSNSTADDGGALYNKKKASVHDEQQVRRFGLVFEANGVKNVFEISEKQEHQEEEVEGSDDDGIREKFSKGDKKTQDILLFLKKAFCFQLFQVFITFGYIIGCIIFISMFYTKNNGDDLSGFSIFFMYFLMIVDSFKIVKESYSFYLVHDLIKYINSGEFLKRQNHKIYHIQQVLMMYETYGHYVSIMMSVHVIVKETNQKIGTLKEIIMGFQGICQLMTIFMLIDMDTSNDSKVYKGFLLFICIKMLELAYVLLTQMLYMAMFFSGQIYQSCKKKNNNKKRASGVTSSVRGSQFKAAQDQQSSSVNKKQSPKFSLRLQTSQDNNQRKDTDLQLDSKLKGNRNSGVWPLFSEETRKASNATINFNKK